MNNYPNALSKTLFYIILGLIQGLTEFLPVSSSGHLALAKSISGISTDGGVAFDLLLHLGTLCAVIVFLRKDVLALLSGTLDIIKRPFTGRIKNAPNDKERLASLTAFATLPLFAVKALSLDKTVESVGESISFVGCVLIVNALLLAFADKNARGDKSISDLRWYHALGIGFFQALAVFPGLSRSGATIAAGLLSSLSRKDALRLSFVISLPAILGACVLKLPELDFSGANALPYTLGALTAFAVGLCAMGVLKKISQKSNYKIFSVYCLAAGIAAVVLGIVK